MIGTILAIGLGLGVVGLTAMRGPGVVDVGARAVSAVGVKVPAAEAAPATRIDYAAFDHRVQLLMEQPDMVGLAVAVVENGRITFAKGYGWADREAGLPVTENTVFRWASLSKGVAASLAYELAEKGELPLAKPVAEFGTSLRLPGGAEWQVTTVDILSHRLGLTKNAYDGKLESNVSPVALRQTLSSAPVQCEPRDCHSYQNVAYDTVSEIVAAATGKTYETEVMERLFRPLGMTGASLGREGLVGAKEWAKPYRRDRQIEVAPAYYRVPAAAGVNSTIVDLAKWMQAQMGEMPDTLSPAVLREIHRPRVDTRRPYGNSAMGQALEGAGYGQGWRSFTYAGHWLVGHSGAVNGYRSTMMFDPAARTGIVMLWNSHAGKPFRLQLELLDLYYGMPAQNWAELDEPAPDIEAQGGPEDIGPSDQTMTRAAR